VELGSVRALPSFVIFSIIFSAQLDDTMWSVCCADEDHVMDLMLENIMQILYFNIFWSLHQSFEDLQYLVFCTSSASHFSGDVGIN
jgi:hypothetical protein